MIFGIQAVLLLSLFSPLTEAFPNLYMSWWVPTNGNLQSYIKAWPRRVTVVFVVWIPIIFILATITQNSVLVGIISALVFLAFSLRLYTSDKSLRENQKKSIITPWMTKIPELFYVLAFFAMGWILYLAVPDKSWLVPLSIATIFLGASIISRFRQKPRTDLTRDVLGRIVFIIGFIFFLYNLVRSVATLA